MGKRNDIIKHSATEDFRGEKPGWLQKRLRWFQELKFGLFIHWGPYSQWDCYESWPLVEEDTWARPDHSRCWVERNKNFERFARDYRALNESFNPLGFNPDKWAEAAAYAGMKYVNFTTKHHDGFCLWNTKSTEYRVTHPSCPFHNNKRADIAGEVFKAFRAQGFGISCYFSKPDWHSPYYWKPGVPARTRNPNYDTAKEPDIWKRFVQYTHRQVEELMTGYGKVDVLWLDGGWVKPPGQDIRMSAMAAMARRHQPGLIIAYRTVGGEFEDFVSPEQAIPEEPLDMPWETCMTMGKHWKYIPDDTYKTVSQLIRTLVEVVSKGGNLLLGAGPDANGAFPDEVITRLKGIGKWMEINKEAIYETVAVKPYREGEIFFTRKGEYIYAIVFSEAAPLSEIRLRKLQPSDNSYVKLLGWKNSLKHEKKGCYTRVHIPEEAKTAAFENGPAVLKFPPCNNSKQYRRPSSF